MSSFPSQPSKPDFWAMQQAVLEFWQQTKAFEQSVEKNPETNAYRFYDGPPFITGTPHYGSLLSSICKDVIPRYQTMKGKKVERVRWRDCHGLPIEQKVQSKLWRSTSKEIEEKGMDIFINECYKYTKATSSERPFYIDNIGRWVDYDNCYKTMDNDYMESVMRVFKQLWDKWLVYKGKRVSMFSTALSTPISSFEVAMDDTYNEINDPAITVKFEITDPTFFENWNVQVKKVYALARTTTPRTIPSNLGLAVSEDILYSTVSYDNAYYVVATKRVEKIFAGKQYEVLGTPYHGSLLVWLSYKPPYDYFLDCPPHHGEVPKAEGSFAKNEKNHRIYPADFVSDDDGTGIVHIAPEFGESDFQLGKKYWLTQTEALDDEWRYTSQITDKVWVFYRDANEPICAELKEKWLLFDKWSITHRVAFCPRSNTPLIFKAQDSRFIDIQQLKPKLLKANEEINRYPAHFKDGRFAKTIEQAPDRCISRTRFWGTPMPIYVMKQTPPPTGSSLPTTGTIMKEVHFLRHGLTDKSLEDGWLTEEGIKQITDLANTLKAQGHPYTQILTSSMKRAIQTAEIVSEILDIPMKIDERFGSVERKRKLKQAKQATMIKFGLKELSLFDCTEEQAHDVFALSFDQDRQTIADLRKYHNPSVLIVSHGEVIQSFTYCINGWTLTQTFGQMPDKWTITHLSLFPSYRIAWSRDDIFRANKPFKQLTKIILIRHGRTDYNEQHKADPEGKSVLTSYGHQQAQAIADHYGTVQIDAIYCSPFARCQQTIAPLADRLHKEIILDKRLGECHAPARQDKHASEREPIQRWAWKPIDGVRGESLEDVYARVKEFLYEKIEKHAGETIVICSHGDPLVMMRKVLADFDYNTDKKKRYIPNNNTMDTSVIEYVDVARKARFDLHRPSIDYIRVMIDGQEYERIPEVLDVWMDSASMPYAQVHYPFRNKAKFEAQFPADYIVEYTGQIRAWFYVMHVLAVALFDRPSYKNVLCTWVMKGNDGRKMSKSYGNFPDPKQSLMQFGWDCIRMHSLLSPVVYGWDVDVKEEWFVEVTKTLLLPLWNAFNFFITYANIDWWKPKQNIQNVQNSSEQWTSLDLKTSEPSELSENKTFLDARILSHLHALIQTVDTNLDHYAMHTASRAIVWFLDNLTNRYIRRSRRRFWKSESDRDKLSAYETLYTVLFTLSKVIAPFMPFLAEHMYRALGGEGSVHHTDFPVADQKKILPDAMASMDRVSKLVTAWLSRRARHNLRVRQPLASATISEKLDDELLAIVQDELNVKVVRVDASLTKSVQTIIKPDGKVLGKKLGAAFKGILTKAKNGEFMRGKDGTVIVDGYTLEQWEFEVDYRSHDEGFDGEIVEGMVVAMDPVLTKELEYEGYARDLIRIIQEARKTANYHLTDRIVVWLGGNDPLMEMVEMFGTLINEETLSEFDEDCVWDQEGEEKFGEMTVRWKIGKR